MSSITSPVLVGAVHGLLGALLLLVWKAGASRWGTWFPLLRKLSEWSLIGIAVVWAFWSLAALGASSSIEQWVTGVGLGLVAFPVSRLVLKGRPQAKTERGASVASVQDVKKMTRKLSRNAKPSLEWGGVPLLKDNEPYHHLVVGATGAGKSVAIRTLADVLRQRGDTVIMVDSGGEFVQRYYREETDVIINPFDSRCVAWSPLAELEGPWDAQSLARSIIPDGQGETKEWNGYAQTLVTSVLQKMTEAGDRRLGRFLYLVQQASVSELKEVLQGTPAMAQLGSEKTFGSIRTIASNYLLPYGYLTDSENPFSVANFVRAHKPGFLFLSYRDDQLDSLRNLISAVLDVASRTLLALPPDSNRRIWLIIDEFASIGKVQSIEAVATKARKNGGVLLIGLQSISQIRDRYGEHAAQSILSCLSTWLVLRCTDAETAEYMSKYIGEAQVVRVNKSESTNAQGDSDSASEQRTTERVVLASEIQALPNLVAFLKTPGGVPVCKIRLQFPAKVDSPEPTFQGRDFKKIPMLDVGRYRPLDVKPAASPVTAQSTQPQPPSPLPVTAAPLAPAARRMPTGTSSAVEQPSRFTKAASAPLPVAPDSAPEPHKFESQRLMELLQRRQMAEAGKPVSVSPAVVDAATRVAAALAQRMKASAAVTTRQAVDSAVSAKPTGAVMPGVVAVRETAQPKADTPAAAATVRPDAAKPTASATPRPSGPMKTVGRPVAFPENTVPAQPEGALKDTPPPTAAAPAQDSAAPDKSTGRQRARSSSKNPAGPSQSQHAPASPAQSKEVPVENLPHTPPVPHPIASKSEAGNPSESEASEKTRRGGTRGRRRGPGARAITRGS